MLYKVLCVNGFLGLVLTPGGLVLSGFPIKCSIAAFAAEVILVELNGKFLTTWICFLTFVDNHIDRVNKELKEVWYFCFIFGSQVLLFLRLNGVYV